MSAFDVFMFYAIACLSGGIVCLIRLFLPSWQIIKQLSTREEGLITLAITSSIFLGMCAMLGPGMLIILRDRENFINNYVKNYLEN